LPHDIPADVYKEKPASEALALVEAVVAQVDGWFASTEQ
jgi:hypothetical protein